MSEKDTVQDLFNYFSNEHDLHLVESELTAVFDILENAKDAEIAALRARVAELEKRKPTTVRGWLEQLPEGYRERALGQCTCLDEKASSMEQAILDFQEWDITEEKGDFWVAVVRHYVKGTPLPPLPNK